MKKSYYKWIVLAIVCFAIFSTSYTQYQLSPLATQLMEMFNLAMGQFSSVFSAPMIPGIFLSLVAGLLVDKFGIKKVIGISLIISVIGTCLRVTAGDFSMMFLCMIMSGVGATFLNSNAAKIVGSYFPKNKISMAMSVFLGASTLSMAIAIGTTGFFSSIKSAFICAAIISLVGTVMWILFVKNPEATNEQEGQSQMSATFGESLKVVIKSKTVWVVGLCLAGILACNVAISSFLPTALIGRGIGVAAAGLYGSILIFGSFVGILLVPVIANKLGKTKPAMLVVALIAALSGVFCWTLPEGIMLGVGLFICGVAVMGIMPLLMSIPVQLREIGPEYAGTAGGFTGTLELMGAVIIPTYVITPIAGKNMNVFFVLVGICMVIVAVLTILLPEVMKEQSSE